jgi:hypothetical protein
MPRKALVNMLRCKRLSKVALRDPFRRPTAPFGEGLERRDFWFPCGYVPAIVDRAWFGRVLARRLARVMLIMRRAIAQPPSNTHDCGVNVSTSGAESARGATNLATPLRVTGR